MRNETRGPSMKGSGGGLGGLGGGGGGLGGFGDGLGGGGGGGDGGGGALGGGGLAERRVLISTAACIPATATLGSNLWGVTRGLP